MADIFISYSKQDRTLAEQLAGLLEEIGFSVWWDAELIPAEEFRKEIRRQIDLSRAAIVIWSQNSATSAFVIDEADVAREAGKLISTLVEGFSANRVPLGFRNTHMTPLSDGDALIRSLAARGLETERSPSRFLLALFRDRMASIRKRRSWLLPTAVLIAAACAVAGLLASYLPITRPEHASPIDRMTASYSYETGDKVSSIKLRTSGVKPFYVRGVRIYVLSRQLEVIKKEEETTVFYDTGSWAPSIQVDSTIRTALVTKGYIATCIHFSSTENGPVSTIGIVRKIVNPYLFESVPNGILLLEFGAAEASTISELSKEHNCSYRL